MNLLVVEDDSIIREGVAEFLRDQEYQVIEAEDGEEALQKFREHTVHLIILDIMMPKLDGIQVLKEIRKTSTVPVIMLTAMSDEATQVRSFDEYADDYVSKPFSLIVLKKRVEALLRRNYQENDIWKKDEVMVDFSGYYATYQGMDVQIKPKEVMILKLLIQHQGQVLTREQILDHIWGTEDAPYDRVVDVYIKNLRKKLFLDCIITVKGIGYKIEL